MILSSWYPTEDQPFLGNFVRQQALFLATKFKVTVVYAYPSASSRTLELKQTEIGNFTEVLVTYPSKRLSFLRFYSKKKAYQLGFAAVQSTIDIIHGHVMLPNLPFFAEAKKYFRCPLMVTEHSSIFREEQKLLTWVQRAVLRRYSSRIDQLFAVSEFQQKDLNTIAKSIPCQVVYNPVDPAFFEPTKSKIAEGFRFIHISTLDEQTKNPEGILNAIAQLKRSYQEKFLFTILSDEPTEKWVDYSKALGISDCVQFEGPCHPQEVLRHLQKSHALVHFSNYESFSLVIAEAWACGIPVISTPVGIAQGMDKHLGMNVSIMDENALAEAMVLMLEKHQAFDPDFIRKFATRYSVEYYVSEITDVINKLVH